MKLIVSRRARRLDIKLDVVELSLATIQEQCIGVFLNWVFVLREIMNELSHHDRRHCCPIPGVFQDHGTRVFPVRLEPDLFSRTPSMNSSI